MNIYFDKTEYPAQVKDESHSVDVFACDGDGLLNLGFYDYENKKWCFHTDTLHDYEDVDFVWMYPPKGLEIKAGFYSKVKIKK